MPWNRKIPNHRQPIPRQCRLLRLLNRRCSPAGTSRGKNGTTNSAIADSTGKYNLTLKDGAKIERYGDRSNNEALSLRGGGQYAQIDDQLFKDAGDSFTLEFASKTRHDNSGKFFSFIVGKDGSNDANTTDQANANKYLMFLQQQDRHQGRYLQQQLG